VQTKLPARKMRVDVVDGSGNRYTVAFTGNVTRDKAIRLLEIVELLGGIPSAHQGENLTISDLSRMNKVRLVVERHFPIVWFSSRDVQTMYEQNLNEPIGLSTVSTYLSRLADRGILTKSGSSNSRRYRVLTEVTQRALNLAKDNKLTSDIKNNGTRF